MRGKKTKPFVYKTIGMMASIGRREGLADIGPLKMQGLPAWLLWRGYYLSQLPGLGLKARVAFDWALSLPFPKDIASIR
jgi:NADH dehydrogenase